MADRRRGPSGWTRFEPTAPREVEGGIRSCSKRGAFAISWWGKRWIAVLESFQIGARLSRGRTYARKGQVADLSIAPGEVRASVQGSRARPYTVSIRLSTLGEADWDKLVQAIAEQPLMAARLLAGEMPEDLEDAARSAGVPIFPAREGDLRTDCSCPDWSNPCKHIAAVYYLLAEAFDRDPFLLLTLRGLTREAFTAMLGPADPTIEPHVAHEPDESDAPRSPAMPLPADIDAFWAGPPKWSLKDIPATSDPTVLVKRLGPLPFWRGHAEFLQAMVNVYESASKASLALKE